MLNSYTQKQRNILIALVAVPVALILLPDLSHLLFNRYPHENLTRTLFLTAFDAIQFLLLVTTAVCIATKKWKFLWPWLLHFGLPLLSFLLLPVLLPINRDLYYSINPLLSLVSDICLLLTPYLVARHFQQKETQLRKAYEVFTKREKRILILVVAIPVALMLLSGLNSALLFSSVPVSISFSLRTIVNVVISNIQRFLLLAIIGYCAVTKQFKILWPLLVFIGLRVIPDILYPINNALRYSLNSLPYEELIISPTLAPERIYWFLSAIIGSLSSIVQHACIWLTPFLVGRYFKNKSQQPISKGETYA